VNTKLDPPRSRQKRIVIEDGEEIRQDGHMLYPFQSARAEGRLRLLHAGKEGAESHCPRAAVEARSHCHGMDKHSEVHSFEKICDRYAVGLARRCVDLIFCFGMSALPHRRQSTNTRYSESVNLTTSIIGKGFIKHPHYIIDMIYSN